MHNNNNYYQCKMCWNKVLTFGVSSIELSFHTIDTCKDAFNIYKFFTTVTFLSNCAEGLHFSAFHYTWESTIIISQQIQYYTMKQSPADAMQITNVL